MDSAPPEFIARLIQGLPVEGYTAVTNQMRDPLNLDILKSAIYKERTTFTYSLKTLILFANNKDIEHANLIDQLAQCVNNSKKKLTQLLTIQNIFNGIGDEEEESIAGGGKERSKSRKSRKNKKSKGRTGIQYSTTRKNIENHTPSIFSRFNLRLLLFTLFSFITSVPEATAAATGVEIQQISQTEHNIRIMVDDTNLKGSTQRGIEFIPPPAQQQQPPAQQQQPPGVEYTTEFGALSNILVWSKKVLSYPIQLITGEPAAAIELSAAEFKEEISAAIMAINDYRKDAENEITALIRDINIPLARDDYISKGTFINATQVERLEALKKELVIVTEAAAADAKAAAAAAFAAEAALKVAATAAKAAAAAAANPHKRTLLSTMWSPTVNIDIEPKIQTDLNSAAKALNASATVPEIKPTTPAPTYRSIASVTADIASATSAITILPAQYQKLLTSVLSPDKLAITFDGDSFNLKTTYTADNTNIYTVIKTIKDLLLTKLSDYSPNKPDYIKINVLIHNLEIIEELKIIEEYNTAGLIKDCIESLGGSSQGTMDRKGLVRLIEKINKIEKTHLSTVKSKIGTQGSTGMSSAAVANLIVQERTIEEARKQLSANIQAGVVNMLDSQVVLTVAATANVAGMVQDIVTNYLMHTVNDTTNAAISYANATSGRIMDVAGERIGQTLDITTETTGKVGEALAAPIIGFFSALGITGYTAYFFLFVLVIISLKSIGFFPVLSGVVRGVIGSVKFVYAIGERGVVYIWRKARGGNLELQSAHSRSTTSRIALTQPRFPRSDIQDISPTYRTRSGRPPLQSQSFLWRSSPYNDVNRGGAGRKKRTSRKRANKRKAHRRHTKKGHANRKR